MLHGWNVFDVRAGVLLNVPFCGLVHFLLFMGDGVSSRVVFSLCLDSVRPLLYPIWQRNIAGARDPEVLSLFAQAIERLGDNVAQYVPRIMEAVFECTLVMITRNFEVGGRNKGFRIACKGDRQSFV